MLYEKLNTWQRSQVLTSNAYKALLNCSDYGFKDQITRCALSVPSNIGIQIGYIKPNAGKQWLQEASELAKMLAAMMHNLKSSI